MPSLTLCCGDCNSVQSGKGWSDHLALKADERVADVAVSADSLSVALMDGRTLSVPLAWYPKLLRAMEEQRRNWKIAGGG